MNLDGRGIPGISIVTTGFTDAIEAQSKALGFEPAVVYVPHPIQNRTRRRAQKDRRRHRRAGAEDAAVRAMTIFGEPLPHFCRAAGNVNLEPFDKYTH